MIEPILQPWGSKHVLRSCHSVLQFEKFGNAMAYPFFPTKNSFWDVPQHNMPVLLPGIAATCVMLVNPPSVVIPRSRWLDSENTIFQKNMKCHMLNSPPTNQSGGMQCLHFWCPLEFWLGGSIELQQVCWLPWLLPAGLAPVLKISPQWAALPNPVV